MNFIFHMYMYIRKGTCRVMVGSFPRPLPPYTSTLNPPSATKIYNIIGRSMEQLVVKF